MVILFAFLLPRFFFLFSLILSLVFAQFAIALKMFSSRLQSNRTYAQAVALLVVCAVKLSAVSSIVSIFRKHINPFMRLHWLFNRNVTLIDNENQMWLDGFQWFCCRFLISVLNMETERFTISFKLILYLYLFYISFSCKNPYSLPHLTG